MWDYIIIGAGSAGSAVAGRLSESGRHRVLLLEAGPSDRNVWIRMPIGYGRTFYDPHVNWMYQTEPVPGFNGRISYWPRGKVLGGSSSINAMVYSRGQEADFAEWEAMGNKGWGWRDVLAAYRKLEDHDLGAGEHHGSGGPLHVTTIDRQAHPLSRLFIAAAQEVGIPPSADLNGATIEGAGLYQITTRKGFRESAASAYLRKRPNLDIVTRAQATKLIFEGSRAVGVAYAQGDRMREARGREIILSAGSIGSPQLLQLSGIGPASVLKAVGIDVRLGNEAVGRNLQDHLCYDFTYRTSAPSLNTVLYPWHGKLRVGLQYVLTRQGPLSLSLNQAGGYYRSDPARKAPDIQLYFSPLTYEKAPPKTRPLMNPDPFPGFYTSISPCKPRSAGHLAIKSADWRAHPSIHPNYLSDPGDLAEMVTAAHFLRKLGAAPSLAAVIDEELKPGPAVTGDAEFAEDIRNRAYSVFHPVGSCRMGPDPGSSVVDPSLRVHGIEGLRVIDASIFPTITSGNTNAPSIMVGERGAGFILEDA
ncbi:GMC family oxidoreductase [Taklimakanibacter lacteus]|uniref:GMC family oxidoreductase n=1 Tax=Taklimakanibacter lacteus TaxID=2268456 RepID=UPI000E67329C